MASSSSSGGKPQVFISFRGADIRDKFLSHLVSALERNGIKVFKDDMNLERGKEIGPSLLKTIGDSNLSIVIFSKGYPNSTFCLDELVKILESKKTKNQIVVPIFYHVDPFDVQQLKGNYKIIDHAPQFQASEVKKWTRALVEISNLSGFNSENPTYMPEAKLCDEIAMEVRRKLRDSSVINSLNHRVSMISRSISITTVHRLVASALTLFFFLPVADT